MFDTITGLSEPPLPFLLHVHFLHGRVSDNASLADQ